MTFLLVLVMLGSLLGGMILLGAAFLHGPDAVTGISITIIP